MRSFSKNLSKQARTPFRRPGLFFNMDFNGYDRIRNTPAVYYTVRLQTGTHFTPVLPPDGILPAFWGKTKAGFLRGRNQIIQSYIVIIVYIL